MRGVLFLGILFWTGFKFQIVKDGQLAFETGFSK